MDEKNDSLAHKHRELEETIRALKDRTSTLDSFKYSLRCLNKDHLSLQKEKKTLDEEKKELETNEYLHLERIGNLQDDLAAAKEKYGEEIVAFRSQIADK